MDADRKFSQHSNSSAYLYILTQYSDRLSGAWHLLVRTPLGDWAIITGPSPSGIRCSAARGSLHKFTKSCSTF